MMGLLSPLLMGAPQTMQRPGGLLSMAGNGYPMGGAFPAGPSGLLAQKPHSSGIMGGLKNLMQPGNMLPIAAQLMGNQGNMGNIGNAMMAGAQGMAQRAQQNKTLEYLRRTDPELAEMVEATGMPLKDAYEISQQRLKAQMPKDLINAGRGRIYDPNKQEWLTAPDMGTDAPTVKEFYDPESGQPYSAQWNPKSSSWERVGGTKAPSGMALRTNPDGSVEFVQGPGAGQKLTEGQSKDVVYFTRGADADAQLATLDTQLTDWTQQNADKIPLGLGNYVRDPQFRQAKVAADGFLAAILRKDTGAAITNQEFELYGPMFLPVPGDDDATIQQKRRARQVALQAIKSGLGTAEAVAEANKVALGIPDGNLPPPPAQGGVVDYQDYFR